MPPPDYSDLDRALAEIEVKDTEYVEKKPVMTRGRFDIALGHKVLGKSSRLSRQDREPVEVLPRPEVPRGWTPVGESPDRYYYKDSPRDVPRDRLSGNLFLRLPDGTEYMIPSEGLGVQTDEHRQLLYLDLPPGLAAIIATRLANHGVPLI